MDIRQFESLARENLRKLVLIFIACLAMAIIGITIADWAYAARGWQSEVVGFLFYAIAAACSLLALIFGINVYAWFSEYRVAKSDAVNFELEYIRKFRSGVIGPIRWK
jgi:hypothetical protein